MKKSKDLDNLLDFTKMCFKNLKPFLSMMIMVAIFSYFAGSANTLAMVAVAIGIQMAPDLGLGTKPVTMGILVMALFIGCGFFASLSLMNPFIGIFINIIFLGMMMVLSCEPMQRCSYILFILCYIFCQSTAVSKADFYLRMLGIWIGSMIMFGRILWRYRGHLFEGLSIREYLGITYTKNKSFIVRMTIGMSIALFIGHFFQITKPLWISIVVMSLTQKDFKRTQERLQHRIYATVLGACLFILLFKIMIPEQFIFLLTSFLGYVLGFLTSYKHKQIINAMSAMNASQVFMDTKTAILDRFEFLLIGIIIVIFMFMASKLYRELKNHGNVLQKNNYRIGSMDHLVNNVTSG